MHHVEGAGQVGCADPLLLAVVASNRDPSVPRELEQPEAFRDIY